MRRVVGFAGLHLVLIAARLLLRLRVLRGAGVVGIEAHWVVSFEFAHSRLRMRSIHYYCLPLLSSG